MLHRTHTVNPPHDQSSPEREEKSATQPSDSDLAQAGKHLVRAARKLVAHLLPAENIAWNTDAVRSSGKLAAKTDDVTTTRSVSRPKARKDSGSR